MRKLSFLIILACIAFHAFAQKGKQVQLTSSESFKGFTKQGVMRVIKPIFSQNGSTLAADSADFNQNANTFDAFGNVIITQPNGTTIYADLLNYNGTTQLAILTNNVKMNDRGMQLTTNFLTYNMRTRMGTYVNGGQIVNEQDVLTSQNGYYFGITQDAYFRYNVLVNTAETIIKTDTLKYNTVSRTAYFYGPTNIKGKKDQTNLYTENGSYNTLTGQAWFGKRNKYTDGSKTLRGDSLYYDRRTGKGKAIGKVVFLDTVQRSELRGDIGVYKELDQSAFVTGHAYVIIETKQDSNKVDSIFMTADTLRTQLILLKNLKPANPAELKSNEEVAKEDAATEENEGGASSDGGLNIMGQTEISNIDSVATDSIPAATKPVRKKGFLSKLFKRKNKVADNVEQSPMDDKKKLDKKSGKALSDSTAVGQNDSLLLDKNLLETKTKSKKIDPRDTARTRIVMAYHKVKIFKSDLQSRSDSAFYSYADSIIRCYRKPLIWTQGSQLSADTIFLQLKNQKLDNMLLQHDGFIVSTELDSSKFNQVKGKVLTGLFKNNQLSQMYVDGNAESIYYTVEDKAYSGMNKTTSSRMRLAFANNKVQEVMVIKKPEGKYTPIEKLNADDEILSGFIWKPNERPKSKEEILGITKTVSLKKNTNKTVPKKSGKTKRK